MAGGEQIQMRKYFLLEWERAGKKGTLSSSLRLEK